MPVTELALFRLLPNTDISSPTFRSNLRKAKHVLEEGSGFDFSLWHCIEDSSLIYLVGAWSSVQFHMEDFIPGPPNQELLHIFKELINVDWMFHIDIDQSKTPLPLGSKTIAIGRHFVKDGEKNGFQNTFDSARPALDSYIGDSTKVIGGWRIDREADEASVKPKDEFVLFTGWESKEQHLQFADSAEFEKYSNIKDHLERAEIMHCARLELED